MSANPSSGIHNFFCFNIPTRAAYDRDPEEPLRQANVKPCFEGQTFAPLPSLAAFSTDFLDAHGDGDFTFNDTYRHASFYEESAVKKAVKSVFEGPMYQGTPPDETWYCALRPEQIATLNMTLPPYTEAFWTNQASKLYVKGSLEQLKKALDEHQQTMRNAYAFLDAAVHQIRNLDVPPEMFVVPQEPPAGWKPYRAEGGVKELKATYHAPPPPVIPSPYDHGVATEAVQAPVPVPAPTPYNPADPFLLPTTTVAAPVEPLAPVLSELEYPASTQPSVIESGPVEYEYASDSTPSTIRAPNLDAMPKLARKGKKRAQGVLSELENTRSQLNFAISDDDSVLENSEAPGGHIDAINPSLLVGTLDYRPLTEEKRADIERWRQGESKQRLPKKLKLTFRAAEVAEKGVSPEEPVINDGLKAPTWASHLRELYENGPRVPPPLRIIKPTRKPALKTSAPKNSKDESNSKNQVSIFDMDSYDDANCDETYQNNAESSRKTKTVPWLSTRIGKRTGGAPKRTENSETTPTVPGGASTLKHEPLPLPSAFKFLNAKPTPYIPPKKLLSFPQIATFTPVQPIPPTPVHTVMAYTGHAQFHVPAGTPSSHGSMPGLLPVSTDEEKERTSLEETIDEEDPVKRLEDLYGMTGEEEMSVDDGKKGSYRIILPVPPYANENDSVSNAFEYQYVGPNNSDASGSADLAICAQPQTTIDTAPRGDALPDIEDIVPDPSRGRKTFRAKKRNADGEVVGRLGSNEREEGRQRLMPREIKSIPYVPSKLDIELRSTKTQDPRRLKRIVERKPTPHPSASVMPVPTRVIRQELNFPRAQGIELDD
ncbi:hypothetical protein SCHPADRAFT_896693 [Schizopora paradoxa]|uniref:Uncharacterized protein n=1 Tax=Schizopora paradoxa TaxID=27342 RepID=A0A0H2R0U0_9AGAM|nr:hypothetical protein SCHPADRAFT_896693 [Schizopora paradoxa]